ncbi:MAG: hypothetical protein FWC60_00755 [Firmicutes bacterium]|nr:hypothetical protein [Bacillota bacterium]
MSLKITEITATKPVTNEKLTATVFLLLIFALFTSLFIKSNVIATESLTAYRTNAVSGTPIFKRVNIVIDALDTAVNSATPEKTYFIEAYGLAQLAMDKKIIPDPNYGALYKTPYGQITYAAQEKQLDGYVDQVRQLENSLAANNIPFLYIQAPFKLPDAHSQLPPTVTDYSNQNADQFINKLTAANISCFDLRPLLAKSGMTQNQLFYNTDHHWTIDAAFYSTAQIVQKLNRDYGFQIDPSLYDIGNYNRTTYKDFFIGSMGRRVGRIYGGVDDFTLLTPKFKTYISLTEDGRLLPRGAFEDAVLSKEYIDPNAPLDADRYAVYHGDNAKLRFENHLVDKGKILIIKDSFGIPVYSFLSLGVHEVRAVDMRLFKSNVAAYAAEFDPNLVIILYNADGFSDQMFDFHM